MRAPSDMHPSELVLVDLDDSEISVNLPEKQQSPPADTSNNGRSSAQNSISQCVWHVHTINLMTEVTQSKKNFWLNLCCMAVRPGFCQRQNSSNPSCLCLSKLKNTCYSDAISFTPYTRIAFIDQWTEQRTYAQRIFSCRPSCCRCK